MNKKISLSISFILLTQACGLKTPSSGLKEGWNEANNPKSMDVATLARANRYTLNFNKLPVEGRLKKQPWSDDYYATAKGGISYRWAAKDGVENDQDLYAYELKSMEDLSAEEIRKLSPAEKYDLFMQNRDYSTVLAERERTEILRTVEGSDVFSPGFSIPTWEGLCHAWAPATLAFEEPKTVTLTNASGVKIPFASSDVKALLTYFLDQVPAPSTQFLGERCELDFGQLSRDLNEGRISKKEYLKKLDSSECRDTNAGAFHMVLANQLGLLDEGFVADVTRDQEVWNQAVHGFKTKIVSRKKGASRGAAPGTLEEVTIHSTMYYTEEVDMSWEPSDPKASEKTKEYDYIVELDKDGNIIGGSWLSEERPDFLWKQETPEFPAEFKGIEKIYKASIDQN